MNLLGNEDVEVGTGEDADADLCTKDQLEAEVVYAVAGDFTLEEIVKIANRAFGEPLSRQQRQQ